MSKFPTIEEKWNKYLETVVPKNASSVQVIETRRSFYAGALAMMHINTLLGDESVSEDEGFQVIDNLMAELKEFGDRIRARQA